MPPGLYFYILLEGYYCDCTSSYLVMSVLIFFPHLNSTYNDNTLQSLSCDARTETRDVTTGDDNLDTLLITHLKLCKGLLQVRNSLWVAMALVVIVDCDYRQK